MDEAQLEVSKKLAKWKVFQTEAEAKQFKLDNPTWSEIGHNNRGWYIGYCKAGELVVKAVLESGRYYKLNVDLAADYIMGINWATCH